MVDDKKLIALVQVNDHLYNRANPRYSSLKEKRQTWQSIANELGTRVPLSFERQTTSSHLPSLMDIVIKRYRILRDRLVREKRLEVLTGNETKHRCPIVERLEFLTPHVFTKNSEGVKIAWSGGVFDPNPTTFPQFLNLPPETSILQDDPNSSLSSQQFTNALHYNNSSHLSSYLSPVSQQFNDSEYSNELPTLNDHRAQRKRKSETISSIKSKQDYDFPSSNNPYDDGISMNDGSFSERHRNLNQYYDPREEQDNEAIQGFCQMILATIGAMSGRKQTQSMLKVTEIVMQVKLATEEQEQASSS